MIEITNLDSVQRQLDAWADEIETLATGVARGVIARTYNQIVYHGPQYSGDFVANLKLSMNAPDTSFDEYVVNPKVNGKLAFGALHEGDRRAIDYAKFHAVYALGSFKLGDTAFISSSATHHSDFYSFKIEQNVIKFRPENPSAVRGQATMLHAAQETADIYAEITPNQARKLAATTILDGGFQ